MITATLRIRRIRGAFDLTPERRWRNDANPTGDAVERPYEFAAMPAERHRIVDALPGHAPAEIVGCDWKAGRLTVTCWARELPPEPTP